MHYEGDAPHANAAAWNVTMLAISKTKRFTDSSIVAKFWTAVDADIHTNKRFLLPRGAEGT